MGCETPLTAVPSVELERLFGSTDSFESVVSKEQSLPGGASLSWHAPQPPVRFPLRDALMSFQEAPPTAQEASLASESLRAKGPLIVTQTQKSRAIREVGRIKRKGLHLAGPMNYDHAPVGTPRAPPEADRPDPNPKAKVSQVTTVKAEHRRRTHADALSHWPNYAPAADLGAQARRRMRDVKGTLASDARILMAHSRRHGVLQPDGSQSEGENDLRLAYPSASMSSAAWSSMRSSKQLPKPVRDWASRGIEFTDRGLGIGERFTVHPAADPAQRSPGAIYDIGQSGSFTRWASESTLPTKQISSKHFSTEVHKMGARREIVSKAVRQPEPGTYELKGFTDELLDKIARRPKPNAHRDCEKP